MEHVIKQTESGKLMWATRLHCLDGMLEQWQLLAQGESQLVVVPAWWMNEIAPAGQLVLVTPSIAGQAESQLHCLGVEGMAGEDARGLWEFHLALTMSAQHGQMIQMLWQFYATLQPGGLQQFFLGILRDQHFISGFYRGRASHHHHHDYEGGLLEHSVEVAMTARMLCQQYQLDPLTSEVAFLGGLLHDVGKLYLYYNSERGEGVCSQHEALNFMKLEPYLQQLIGQDPRVFEALTACLSASIGKPLIQYMPETIVKMADRLSAEVFNWRKVFVGLPDFYWFRKSTSEERIYKRLGQG